MTRPRAAATVELRQAAHDAAARGWHVFPLVPGTKRPAVTSWETRATVDPAQVARCWSAGPFNVGIACGPSGLLVVDLDMPKPAPGDGPHRAPIPATGSGADMFAALCAAAGQPVPTGTFTVGTPSGGRHLYYAALAGPDAPRLRNTAGTLAPLVDTRGHGGYVVAAGSVLNPEVDPGFIYTVLDDRGPAALPPWLVQRLTPTPVPPVAHMTVDLGRLDDLGRDTNRRQAAYVTVALRREVDRVAGALPGGRNQALFVAAVALGQLVAGGALPERVVRQALNQAAGAAGLPPHEIAPTLTSGLKVGARRPRKVAA